MTDIKKYSIEIETPDGVLVTSEQHELATAKYQADVELPAGYVATESGELVVETPVETQAAETADEMLEKQRQHLGLKVSRTITNTIVHIVLVLMSIIWLFPFVCIVLESFRVESTGQVNYIIPKQWGLDNYIRLFTNTNFPRWFLNTFVLGLAVAVIQTLMVLAMSYVLSRIRFKGRKSLMNLMLVLGMFPGFLTLILLYKLLSGWGLTGSGGLFGLILVYTASSGMGYYVSKGYFDTIPKSLDEAARVDGATRAQVMFKVILPMAKPIVIYTILMGFMAPWGDFVLAKYISHFDEAGMNVAVGLQNLIATNANKSAYYTTFCAGGVVVAIPITILFMCLQKYYVEGVTGGAVKG